jgi:hypothetical protein
LASTKNVCEFSRLIFFRLNFRIFSEIQSREIKKRSLNNYLDFRKPVDFDKKSEVLDKSEKISLQRAVIYLTKIKEIQTEIQENQKFILSKFFL